MKHTIIAILLAGMSFYSSAQIIQPIKWSYGLKKRSQRIYEIHLRADLDNGWHLYSQLQPQNAVGKPILIVYKPEIYYIKVGKLNEKGVLEHFFDKTTGISANEYSNSVDFVQLVKVKSDNPIIVSGVITYQVCSDNMCLSPETKSFAIQIK